MIIKGFRNLYNRSVTVDKRVIMINQGQCILQPFRHFMYLIFLNIWIPQLFTVLVLKFEQVSFYYLWKCLKTAGCVVNSADPYQMPHSVASDLGLHCMLRYVCLNT